MSSLWKLRVSMFGTLSVIIGLSTLFFAGILYVADISFMVLPFIIVAFNIAQWLFAPYLIDKIYRVKEASRPENQELYKIVERLSKKSGVNMPKVMLAKISLPNAFAYGSPIAGTRMAVTKGLLDTLETEEVEAVIGHELGHLKHKDVQVMMIVSLLPALFYAVGLSMLFSSRAGRNERSGGAAVIGLVSIILYWILTLFTLYLSRLREYYADRHSIMIVEEGPRKLSEGLAKIVHSTGKMRKHRRDKGGSSSFKSLFITDPDRAHLDVRSMERGLHSADRRLVDDVLGRRITTLDRVVEVFSTHPNIVKRLKALQELT